LLGASLSYAAFERKLGRTAAWVGGLAAFIPDADVFIRSHTDPLVAIEYHRQFTHALAFAPIGAALAAAVALIPRTHRKRTFTLWMCATLAYVSHCLLDAATSYGTQLFWPFTTLRVGWDFISIIDPLFTLTLAIALTWALIRQRSRIAAIGATLCLLYMAFGVLQHARALQAQSTLAEARSHERERFEVMPTVGNNLVWRSLYLHDGQIQSDRIRVGWFSGASVREGEQLPQVNVEDLTAAEIARNRNDSFQRFAWFSDQWVARSPHDATVYGDMRYSLSSESFDPIWGIRFTSPEAPADVAWINQTRERKIDPAELWREIIGADSRFKPLDQLR
jgi:inner membrane protein